MKSSSQVILFQGDSITDGGRPRDREGLGSSYPFLIASYLGKKLAKNTPVFYNRGISGNRVGDMSARWSEDAYVLNPDLISILIGVNDAWRTVDDLPQGKMDRFERIYDALLAEVSELQPNAKLVLMEPFVLNTDKTTEKWDMWQQIIPRYQRITKELAERYNAVFIPLQDLFNEACEKAEANHWLYDGVHPTAAGHKLIADQWLSVVSQSAAAHVIESK